MTTTETAFIDFPDAVFRPALAEADQPDPLTCLFDSLVYRPSIYRRDKIRWIAVHNWRSGQKSMGVAVLRQVKQRPRPGFLKRAAQPIAAIIHELYGAVPVEAITCVPCGHSRRHDCFGKGLAQAVAASLTLPFVQIFADRFCLGVSHPKQSANLEPLRLVARPPRSVMVIDDVATSGQHLEEIILTLRHTGVSVSAMVLISGSSKAGTPLLQAKQDTAGQFERRSARPLAIPFRDDTGGPLGRFWSRAGLCDTLRERWDR